MHMSVHHRHHAAAVERWLAGQHLVGNDAKRVLVRRPRHRLRRDLLGTHVRRRADRQAGARQLLGLGHLGDAEVGDHCPAFVVDQNVARLDVAVDHAAAVRIAERAGDLAQDGLHHRDGQRSQLTDDRVEGATLDVLHHEVEQMLAVTNRVDRNDVGMAERRGGLGLTPETLDPVAEAQHRRHDLDGDLAVERDVMREIHRRHPAATKLAGDVVVAEGGGSKRLQLPAIGDG